MPIAETLNPSTDILPVLRRTGYTIEVAIADMIDNCITAEAKKISINMHASPEIEDSWITVEDDGHGMTETELIENLRMTTKKKAGLYEDKEGGLGRFGIGAKLAPLSFCKSVTVYTKKNGSISIRRWDVDHVSKTKKFQLLTKKYEHGNQKILDNILDETLDKINSGTTFLCQKLDGFLDDYEVKYRSKEKLHQAIYAKRLFIRDYLLMTHYEYLKSGNLKIVINNNPEDMVPWDPFCTYHKKTKVIGPKILNYGNSKCKITGYILPRRNEFESKNKLSRRSRWLERWRMGR